MILRLFIAIDLDHAGKRSLTKLIDRLGRPPGKIRWVGPDQMHLTLSFLGETPEDRKDAIVEAMSRAAATVEPFGFALAGLGSFPDWRRPRVIWVGVTEPTGALTRLHAALTRELAGLGFAPEQRDFSPHITLGRVKLLDRKADYESLFAGLSDYAGPAQSADRLTLISSQTLPNGPRYTAVAAAALGQR